MGKIHEVVVPKPDRSRAIDLRGPSIRRIKRQIKQGKKNTLTMRGQYIPKTYVLKKKGETIATASIEQLSAVSKLIRRAKDESGLMVEARKGRIVYHDPGVRL